MDKYENVRELTKDEIIKYAKEIKKSRSDADSYVFGYKKKEVIDVVDNEIKTLAKGEKGVGWLCVASCRINQPHHLK
jgi:hypothetical protein